MRLLSRGLARKSAIPTRRPAAYFIFIRGVRASLFSSLKSGMRDRWKVEKFAVEKQKRR